MAIKIENVWRKSVPKIREEVIDFWKVNKLLPAGVSPEERALDVVLILREESGGIVGISSAFHIQFKQLNNNYFFAYRSVILPSHRIPGLAQKIIVETRDILEEYAKTMTENKCIGMVSFVENKGVMEKINDAVWPSSKMVYIGNDKQGRQVRLYYFKGAMI
jgi:hypothetical protein